MRPPQLHCSQTTLKDLSMPHPPVHDVTVTALGRTVTLTSRFPTGLKIGPARLVMTPAEARALALSLPHLDANSDKLDFHIISGYWTFIFVREGDSIHIHWQSPDINGKNLNGKSTETIEYLQGALLKNNAEPQERKGAQNHALDVRPAPRDTTNGNPPGVVLISHRQGHTTEIYLDLHTAHALAEFIIIEKLTVMLTGAPTSVFLARHGQVLNLKFVKQIRPAEVISNLKIPANTLPDLRQKLRNAITSAKTLPDHNTPAPHSNAEHLRHRVRTYLLTLPESRFTNAELRHLTDDAKALDRVLSKLNRAREIERVRPGVYLRKNIRLDTHARFEQSLPARITQHLRAHVGLNEPFTTETFAGFGKKTSVESAIHRLAKTGAIIRIEPGVYLQSGEKAR